MAKIVYTFNEIISVNNLLMAWEEFLSGKKETVLCEAVFPGALAQHFAVT